MRAIRHRHPEARITALTKRAHVPLLQDNPNLTEVSALEPGQSLTGLAAALREKNYTHLLDLHDNLRSRVLRTLVPGPWRGYPKHRGARALLIHRKRNRYPVHRPVAERYFVAAQGLDVQPDGDPPDFFLAAPARAEAGSWLGEAGLGAGPLIAVAPGAAHATKRWPAEHWRLLVDRLIAAGMDVVVVGGAADAVAAEELAGKGGKGSGVLPAYSDCKRRAPFCSTPARVVSGDTGVMHMATAVGTPVVALFGPTVEAFGFFPYTRRAEVLQLELACRPCSSQGGPRCPLGHHHCLTQLGPDTVYAAVRRSVA